MQISLGETLKSKDINYIQLHKNVISNSRPYNMVYGRIGRSCNKRLDLDKTSTRTVTSARFTNIVK